MVVDGWCGVLEDTLFVLAMSVIEVYFIVRLHFCVVESTNYLQNYLALFCVAGKLPKHFCLKTDNSVKSLK